MSEIRKEYKNYKPINEQKAKTWIMHNVILLNERFDRSTLHRLNSSIQRFDEKFGPYRNKLPAIAKVIGDAEKGLYVVITGGASKKSAGHMLERMTLIYNILSNFFGHDLQMLLKTPVFRTAVAMPDKALNIIEHPNHNPKMIKKVFLAALKPDKVEREVFDRAYKNIPMPSLNWNDAANQLMGLCVDDLNHLCGIEKVPAIVVDNNITSDPLDSKQLQEQMTVVEQRPEFRQLQAAINNVINFGNQYKFSDTFMNSINELSNRLVDIIGNQTLARRLLNSLKSLGGTISATDPVARLLTQTTRVAQTFNTIRQIWNENKNMFMSRAKNSGSTEDRDIAAVRGLMERALERGGQIATGIERLNVTRIADAPGLAPRDIIQEFIDNVVKKDLREATSYTIKFNKNYATAGDAPSDMSVSIRNTSDKIRLPDKGALDKVGRDNTGNVINFRFDGWATDPRGNNKVGDPGDDYRPTSNVTLYANWVKVTPPGSTP